MSLLARILDRDQQGLDNFKITMREKNVENPRDCVFWLNNALEESIDFPDISSRLFNLIIIYKTKTKN